MTNTFCFWVIRKHLPVETDIIILFNIVICAHACIMLFQLTPIYRMVSEVCWLMANLQLKPPEQFDFRKPDEWPRWSKRFEQFRVASGLSDKSDTRQVCTLLYCLRNEAEDVLRSTNILEDDRKKYKEVHATLFFKWKKTLYLSGHALTAGIS